MSRIKEQFYDDEKVRERLTAMEAEAQNERAALTEGEEGQKKSDNKIESDQSAPKAKRSDKSHATILIELASEAELFHTPNGEPYATIIVDGHKETWPLKARGFRGWLMKSFYESERSAPSMQAVQEALGVLTGKAQFGEEALSCEVHTRIAEYDGALYLDLSDEQWRAVHITRDGWEITSEIPVKFRRTKGMLHLPEPARGGNINILRHFINITDDDWPLVLGWLVATFRPGKPFPILALHGEQGSAKSTTARILRDLIDPNKAPLRSEPPKEKDLIIAATNSWLVALDNLSNLRVWLSDALCRLATGGGYATRELFENDDEMIFEAMRPILLNGIEELATRSDLLDRAIVLTLPTISEDKRRDEASLWCEFEAARPAILGALMDALSVALRQLEYVRLEKLPRMADFARWATAAESAFGLEAGDFMSAYNSNRTKANELALEATEVAGAVISFAKNRKRWTGTVGELLKELNLIVGDEGQRQRSWPKTSRGLSSELKRRAPNLRAAGVTLTELRREGGTGRRLYSLELSNPHASQSSQQSQGARLPGIERDDLSGLASQDCLKNLSNYEVVDGCDGCDEENLSFSEFEDEYPGIPDL